ncbi:MAG: pyridoxamine 5'-phosphate oxidase [Gemmatimonadota bacterium]
MSILSTLRAIFTLGKGVTVGLRELDAGSDPIALFGEWFEAAKRAGIFMPESMALATATKDGAPSVRLVLLKRHDARGFVFFTNYGSRKADELADNPRAALALHWHVLERQIRIEGPVEKIPYDESVAYFRTRARGSRIGAWASAQSRPLKSRAELEAKVREFDRKFPGDDVPLPDFWGGYRVIPERIEFWQGKANRLHDRLLYERTDGGWRVTRLYP